MINKLLPVALMLLIPSALIAQRKVAAVDPVARCAEKLIPYGEWDAAKNPIGRQDWVTASKGRLYYFPANHATDPADPQFREIERAWSEVKPTIAFYEGPNRPLAATRDETIRQAGESGFVRFLATRDGIQFVTLEPTPQAEAKFIMQKFSPEQVK